MVASSTAFYKKGRCPASVQRVVIFFKIRGQAVTPSRKQMEKVSPGASNMSLSASDISVSAAGKDQHKQLLADQAGCCRPVFQKMLRC